MQLEDRIKMFKDVFAPKAEEKVLFLVDTPHGNLHDTDVWSARREMVQDWYKTFKEMGAAADFSVDILEYKATGQHNSPLSKELIDVVLYFLRNRVSHNYRVGHRVYILDKVEGAYPYIY